MLSLASAGVCRQLLVATKPKSLAAPLWPRHLGDTRRAPRGQARAAFAAAERHKLVFLGTPRVACVVLQALFDAARLPGASFEVHAVVSQPDRPRGRGNRRVLLPSPVSSLAMENGVSEDRLLLPDSARDEVFLSSLRLLEPDLCVTAAYGNFLPQGFLDIPKFGTLNVHPSLLPKYRGAAPVSRALQDGLAVTGVSVAFTVLKMDSGPILAQEEIAVNEDTDAMDLLDQSFRIGAGLLVDSLDCVWEGGAWERAVPQDESQATLAPKLSKAEGMLDFRDTAVRLHNQVRAFVPWPGTRAAFIAVDPNSGKWREVQLGIMKTQVAKGMEMRSLGPEPMVVFEGASMFIRCGGGSVLEVLEVQPQNGKRMPVADYKNGLAGRTLKLKDVGWSKSEAQVQL